MNKKIIQKTLLTKIECEILDTKINYKINNLGIVYNYIIKYEELDNNKEEVILNRKNFYIPPLSLLIILIAFFLSKDKFSIELIDIVFMILFILTSRIYLISLENVWQFNINNLIKIYFYKNKPNINQVNDFLKDLFYQRDKYLREVYFLNANKNIDYEKQKYILQWLRKKEVLTSNEFTNSINELDSIFNNKEFKIGFK